MSNDQRRHRVAPASAEEDPNVELREYASPPCLMHELDPAARGPLLHDELVTALQEMLRGARWRARAIRDAARQQPVQSSRAGPLQAMGCEQRRCVLRLCVMLRRLDVAPAAETGLVGDTQPVACDAEWLRWLADGVDAELRRLRETVPRMADDGLYDIGNEIIASHARIRATCAELL